MKRGKRICSQLKAVRRQIADENNIPLNQPECTHKGECRGTCPRCEAEVRYLEQALSQRLSLGRMASVAGLTLTLAACGGGNGSTVTTDRPLSVADSPLVEQPLTPKDTEAQDLTNVPPVPDDELEISTGDMGLVIDVPIKEDDVAIKEDDVATKEDDEAVEEMLLGIIEEEYASFPGGEEALYQFLNEHIHYPDEARKEGIEGKVYVRFTIDTDGTISDAVVLRDIGGGCGEEVLRVVKEMPKWIPGKQSGKVVRSSFALPVTFSPEGDPAK